MATQLLKLKLDKKPTRSTIERMLAVDKPLQDVDLDISFMAFLETNLPMCDQVAKKFALLKYLAWIVEEAYNTYANMAGFDA